MVTRLVKVQTRGEERGIRNRNIFLSFLAVVSLVVTQLWIQEMGRIQPTGRIQEMGCMPNHEISISDIPIKALSPVNTREYLIPDTPDPLPLSKIHNAIPSNADPDPLKTCNVTTQVRIQIKENHDPWILQSLDSNGNIKTSGGDVFYIVYHDQSNNDRANIDVNSNQSSHPTAVAIIQDLMDGTYSLDFTTTPLNPQFSAENRGGGKLTIHFVFSCFIGQMPPPTKEHWKNGGYSQTAYTLPLEEAPPIRPFQPPTPPVDFNQYDDVLLVGDSTMEQFGLHIKGLHQKRQTFRSNIRFDNNIGQALSLSTLDSFQAQVTKGLTKISNRNKTALVIGSSVWDVIEPHLEQGQYYLDHRTACRKLVRWIQTNFPEVKLCWKSPSDAHPHVVLKKFRHFPNYEKAIQRIKYVSQSRFESLHHWQQEIMQELSVCFLDVYEAYHISADWHYPGDSRHFRPELNQRILNYFYASPDNTGDTTFDYTYKN
jgi:hypothetical protein